MDGSFSHAMPCHANAMSLPTYLTLPSYLTYVRVRRARQSSSRNHGN